MTRRYTRRRFLEGCFGACAAAVAGAAWPLGARAGLPRGLRITDLKTFLVGRRVFVKVYTSAGVTGLGEGSFGGRGAAVAAALEAHKRLLVGRDPTEIERRWQEMFRWPRARHGAVLTSAISAVDLALWDVLGKLLDVPVYRLLGGAARDRVRLYAHVRGRDPAQVAEATAAAREAGFTAVRSGIAFQPIDAKIKRPWDLKLAVRLVEAMREAAGDGVDLIEDAHGLLTPAEALEYAEALEPLRLLFLEDPVQPEDLDGLRRIRERTSVPVAVGESLFGKFGFHRLVNGRLVDYVRPDCLHAGGISEVSKIAHLAGANFVDVALHVGVSPVSNLAACHVAAATDNVVIVELTGHPDRRAQRERDLFGGDIVVRDGHALLPERPGLGCDLDEAAAARIPYVPHDKPRLEYEDGRPGNW